LLKQCRQHALAQETGAAGDDDIHGVSFLPDVSRRAF
jgi:hypothetical protein